MNKHEVRVCPRCKSSFECKQGTITQCQCYTVNLTAEQRAFIEQRYQDCLCRDCLGHLSEELHFFKERYIYR
ncbi:MAG: cysteine-rich CWC family protein [Chitinophagaceae bacterium]